VKVRRHPEQEDARSGRPIPEDPAKEILQFLFERRDEPAKEIYELLVQVLRPEASGGSADGELEKHETVGRFVRACKKLERRSGHAPLLRDVEWIVRKFANDSRWKIGWKNKRRFQKLETQLDALSTPHVAEQRFQAILANPSKPMGALIAELDPVETLAVQVVELSDRLPKNSERWRRIAWVILDIKRHQQELLETGSREKDLYWEEAIQSLRDAAQDLRQELCPLEAPVTEEGKTQQSQEKQEAEFTREVVSGPVKGMVEAQAVWKEELEEWKRQTAQMLEEYWEAQDEYSGVLREYRGEIEGQIRRIVTEVEDRLKEELRLLREQMREWVRQETQTPLTMPEEPDRTECEPEWEKRLSHLWEAVLADGKQVPAEARALLDGALKGRSVSAEEQEALKALARRLERIGQELSALLTAVRVEGGATAELEQAAKKCATLLTEVRAYEQSVRAQRLELTVSVPLQEEQGKTVLENVARALQTATRKMLDPVGYFTEQVDRLVVDDVSSVIDLCAGLERNGQSRELARQLLERQALLVGGK